MTGLEMDGFLILEDGSRLKGRLFGHPSEVAGEVVFNTGMVGYTECMTDPSYAGQVLLFTYPLLGCYGVPDEGACDRFGFPRGFESERIQTAGIVVNSLQENPSHHSSSKTLHEWMKGQKIPGIEIEDTRALTKRIRERGTMRGRICLSENSSDFKNPIDRNPVESVTTKGVKEYSCGHSSRIVLIDCGVKAGIIKNLMARNMDVIRVPYDFSLDEILSYEPSGILVSNGPGDPRACQKTVKTVGEALEGDLPIMGVCLGLQILSLASGAVTHKLKFGHRGQNHPVIDRKTKKCYMTSQNHGYGVDAVSLENTDFEISFLNANDGSVEGIAHRKKKAFAVQFHPEGCPGPLDTNHLFDIFVRNVSEYGNGEREKKWMLERLSCSVREQ